MPKYLRVPANQQTTATNGQFVIDPSMIVYMTSGTDSTLLLYLNTGATGNDLLTLTFSTASAARITHEIVARYICLAAKDKGNHPVELIMPAGTVALAFS
jgi:hypothetical protein